MMPHFYLDTSGSGLTAPQINERLMARGVRIGAFSDSLMRAVTHLDIDRAGVEEAAEVLREAMQA